jgi:TolB-like protein/Tfp pilus assembly protein PilF
MSLFGELQRRNVVRVAIAYSIIAWLIAQVADFAFETFGAPDWALKSLVILLLLGLPVALFVAWAFEITPEGVKREKDVDRSQSITARTGRKLDRTIIAGLVVVGLLIVARPWLPGRVDSSATPSSPDAVVENSIAVLPFNDLSPDGDQEYFSDGISEEILNALVRIPGLKVTGRTSSFSYKGRNEDLRTISETLGVEHVLEGSVRRSGERLRISAQLIRGEDGIHLWSETYDRELTDIFAIQDEIAQSVAEQLALSLGLGQRALVTDKTNDLVVYENYLQAHDLSIRRGADNLDMALLLLQEAAARDPAYAPVWTEIAGVYTNYYAYQELERRQSLGLQWNAIGMAAAKRAIALNPADGVAHAHLGVFQAYGNQWVEAFRSFDRAIDLAPNNALVADTIAQQMIEVGYIDEMLELTDQAIETDPLVAMYHNTRGRGLSALGKPDQAIDAYDRGIELDSRLRFPHGNKLRALAGQGRFDEMVAASRKAVQDSDFPTWILERFMELPNVVGDEVASREWLEQDADRAPPPELWVYLVNDTDKAAELITERWREDNRAERFLFTPGLEFMYMDDRWKTAIRRYGILDLWRTRGFPEWCRPLEGDDFECTPP